MHCYPFALVESKKKVLWTSKEEEMLLDGVKIYGEGRWAVILKQYSFNPHQTNVHLKDKWRNMKKNKEVPAIYKNYYITESCHSCAFLL